jgi:hypothetical protein
LTAWGIWTVLNKYFEEKTQPFRIKKTTDMNELAMVGQRARRKYANNFRD